MSRQYWQEALAWAVADGTAIANTTTETIIFPNVTIPANYLADGRILRLTAYGRHSTTGTPTIQFSVRWGGVAGTLLCQSGTITCGSAVSAAMWRVEVIIVTRANGSSGSLFATGLSTVADDAASTVGSATNTHGADLMGSGGVATPAAVTVDLTADTALSITAKWGTASSSNTLTGHQYLLETLN
jgi:hypothetical protein